MNCIHGGTVGLCRQCEHDGPKLAADPRDARDCGDCVSFTHVAAERDRLAARVAELEAQANRWQDVANETAANYWRLTQERNRLRRALDAVHMDSVACAPESGPKQYCITEWALSKVREALAYVADTPPRITEGDTPSRMPDPTAARLTPEVCSDEIRGLVEWVHGLTIREARELRRMWEARAEHAALLRVAKAALDYWVYETKTNREGLRAALTELRRARAGKDGGSDG